MKFYVSSSMKCKNIKNVSSSNRPYLNLMALDENIKIDTQSSYEDNIYIYSLSFFEKFWT
jgi:hypothetical protein